ncbi:response regulator transcription factor [Bacteroides sp.]
MIRLLLVEDDANLRYMIQGGLEDMIGGYEIKDAANGEEGLLIWQEWHPDVIVLDIEMPVMDGYEMVKRIRETDQDTPILFSSGRVSPKDVVKGYELGVNNYLKKPFLPEELNAHVQALMKMKQKASVATPAPESPAATEGIYPIGKNYMLDAEHVTLKHISGLSHTLTARETQLLQMLCEKKGEVVKRENILEKLWGTEDDYFASRSLDVFVTKLRKRFAEDQAITIKTIKGVGLSLLEM